MTVKTVDSNQARNNWREMLDTVMAQDIDVVVTRYNKPVVTVVSYEDYLIVQEELTKRRAERKAQQQLEGESLATMLASEYVLAREWNTPEEDEAWADL
ncbi:MAG: type II toxin-antitoxin system prevent-host-death family antitoxin [Candidatus Promineifilaceae bacterium]